MKVVIMAGGRGKRISDLFPDIPKPLVPIAGVPILERELLSLKRQGFDDIILTVSYMSDRIMDYFGDGRKLGLHIEYFEEEVPLGNAGALFKIRNKLEGDFLLLNADVAFDIDVRKFIAYHKEKQARVTLFTHPNSHPFDSGIVLADSKNCVCGWLTKEDKKPEFYKNRTNAGLHVMNVSVLDEADVDIVSIGEKKGDLVYKVDLDRQILKPLCGTGAMFCYDSPEYVKDMGTPERYRTVDEDFCKGIAEKKNLSNKQRAIFLDRDGTINQYVGFLRKIEELELLEGAAAAIRSINESGCLAIVITNQPVIARGEVSIEELEHIHEKLETLLGNEGAYVDAIYYCPHHPDKGYEGEVAELKVDCDCRKPRPGLLLQAAEDYHIDLETSIMIGDSKNDIEAGKKAGCKTVLIGDGEFGQDVTASSLYEFIENWRMELQENSVK